ncbi:MAG: zinc-ribbon domain-containing protein [Proteobacteria bacterium]|nr:zinc-ribbon domain-containing protein [Pseudomonadota bacterium]
MLVKCDKCGQGYEVSESRIPPQGARIKCPSCANIFVVRAGGMAAPQQVSRVRTSSMAQSFSEKPAEPVSEPAPAVTNNSNDAKNDAENGWQIRHIGLTYSFHDLSSLHDWLSGRPSLEGVKVSKEGEDWKELGDYPEVMTTELITKFFPLGDVPTSKSKASGSSGAASSSDSAALGLLSVSAISPISNSSDLSVTLPSAAKKNPKQAKQERLKAEVAKKEQKKKWITITILALVLIAAVVAAMRFSRTGEVLSLGKSQEPVVENETPTAAEVHSDIETIHKTNPETVAAKAQDPEANAEDLPKPISDDELRKIAEADLQKRFEEAQQMVQNKQWPEARATLENIIQDKSDVAVEWLNNDNNQIEALQLLSKTYRGLGLNNKANETDATIKWLKSDKAK